MNKAKPNIHLIILFSAVLIALLTQIRTIMFVVDMITDGKQISLLSERESVFIQNSVWFLVNSIILFYVTAVFNFSWNNRMGRSNRFRPFNVFFIFITNMILLFGLSTLGSVIYKFYFQENISTFIMALKNLFVFIFALLFAYILILIEKNRTAELDYARLKEEKIKAELVSLKEQISPHFLFNTLNSLSSVIRLSDKNESLKFVDKMSQVYRYILESNRQDLVKIKDEIEFLGAYFFLLEKRFGKKLVLEMDISPGLYETFIPPMAMQLPVENVFQHNTITNSSPLTIKIFDKDKMIWIQNNLQKKKGSESFGIGLANLMKRYRLIAGKEIIIKENTDSFIVKLPVIK